jgi:hypothetical protein
MSEKPTSPLRQRLIDDMTARRFTKTRRGTVPQGAGVRNPSPIEASKGAVCYVRFTEGFRMPAPGAGASSGTAGPAFESLVRRKPRGGRALFGWARPMGI